MSKKPSAGVLVAAMLTGAAGAGFGYLAAGGLLKPSGILGWLAVSLQALNAWDLLALPVLFLLVIAVHELGHLTGGLASGMKFLLLIFGPFQWSATPEGVRFRWVTNLGLMGGIAATMPVKMDNLRNQLLPMIAGGPLASLGLAVVAAAIAVSSSGRLAGYTSIISLLSTAIFLVTAIPFRAGGFMSDGMQLVEVLRGGVGVVERSDLVRLMAQSLAGTRPRDWDADLVTRLETMNSAEPLRLMACWMLLLQRAMDQHDAEGAAVLARRLAERCEEYPDGFRQSLHIELCIEASLRQDQATAETHLARTAGGVTERSRLELARALVCSLQGDDTGAAKHRAAGRRLLMQAMDPGLARLTVDQLT